MGTQPAGRGAGGRGRGWLARLMAQSWGLLCLALLALLQDVAAQTRAANEAATPDYELTVGGLIGIGVMAGFGDGPMILIWFLLKGCLSYKPKRQGNDHE